MKHDTAIRLVTAAVAAGCLACTAVLCVVLLKACSKIVPRMAATTWADAPHVAAAREHLRRSYGKGRLCSPAQATIR